MSDDRKTPSTLNRRELLIAAGGGVLATGLGGLLGPQAFAATSMPRTGGHARFGIGSGSTSDTLDPATFASTYMQLVGLALRNCLTEMDDGKLVPSLATSWEASPDARQWTFKLRKGVTFHSGKTMTSKDVVASIRHHMGKNSKSGAKPLVANITAIEAPDAHTVVFKLQSGNADWPYLMADYHLEIMPAKGDGVDWQSGDGTGGYKLEHYEPGVRTTLSRYPGYFKIPHRAHFESVTVLSIKDVAARTSALTTGQIDIMNRADLKTVGLLQRRAGIKLFNVTGSQQYTIPMMVNTPPFDDNNVRMALKLAVPREAMVQKILYGYGKVGNDNPITPATTFYADLPQRHYDPDRARHYLKKAGHSRLRVDLRAADAAFAGAVEAAVLYSAEAAKAGLDIHVIRVPNDGYWSNVWNKKPFVMCYWGGRPTADWMFTVEFAKNAPWNDTRWDDPKFQKLLVEARAELNEAKRREMYREMQEIIRDQGGDIVAMLANYVGAFRSKVHHPPKIGNSLDLDDMRAVERWWFA